MRAHVIVNRQARRLARGPLLGELGRHRSDVEVVETSSLADLDVVAASIAARGGDDAVVLAGGDGSYMAGVTALARAFGDRPLPPIALAPGGTVGTVARNWGMRGDPVRWSARLLDRITSGTFETSLRPTLRVGERVGFIFGAGLVARFFELYEARGATGNVAAARLVARIFGGSFVGGALARHVLEPVPCSVVVNGETAPFDRVSLLCASVVPDLGLHMRLTYRAGEERDRFHVVATPLGPRALGPQMPLVLAGRPLVGRRVDELARELELRFPPGSGAYVLDGDLFRADAITVRVGPLLRLLT